MKYHDPTEEPTLTEIGLDRIAYEKAVWWKPWQERQATHVVARLRYAAYCEHTEEAAVLIPIPIHVDENLKAWDWTHIVDEAFEMLTCPSDHTKDRASPANKGEDDDGNNDLLHGTKTRRPRKPNQLL